MKGNSGNMELHAYIDEKSDGKPFINYDDQFFQKKIDSFKSSNVHHRLLIRFEIIDKPEYYLHKYYRGYLLPDLTMAMGEVDVDYIHIEMKKKYLYQKVDQLSEVPSRYRSRCNYFIESRNEKDVFVGYTPSTGDIPHKDMKDYIQKLEHILFVDIGGAIDPRHQEQAKEYRSRGFDEETKMEDGNVDNT